MPSHAPYEITIVSDPSLLTAWTIAQFSSFLNTNNVIADTLFPSSNPPSPSDITAGTARHIAALTADGPNHIVYIQITDPSNNNAIMGGAKWQFWPSDPHRPLTFPCDFAGDDVTDVGRQERAFAQKVMDEFQGRRAKDMACPHGLLDICFTTPEYERKGVATALVEWGLRIVDEQGWVAFTEASVRGEKVYHRLGFERVEEVRLRFDELGEVAKGKGDVVWMFMNRPARKVSES